MPTAPRPICPVFHCQCGDHAWAALTRGFITLVSPQDAWLLELRAWSILLSHGIPRYVQSGSGLLHKMIMGNKQVDYQIRTDHKNRNGFDNRRSNLRECTPSQNSANTKHTNKHGFRGVFSITRSLAPISA